MQSQAKWALLIVALFGVAIWAITVAARLILMITCAIFDLVRYVVSKISKHNQAKRAERDQGIRLSRKWAAIKQHNEDAEWLSTCHATSAFKGRKSQYRLIDKDGACNARITFDRGLCVKEEIFDKSHQSAVLMWMDNTTYEATKPSKPKLVKPKKRKYTRRKIRF